MYTLKNSHFINEPDIREKLELSAVYYKRYARISFKIISRTPKEIVIHIRQEKTPYNNYADAKKIISIGKEVFSLLEGLTLIIHAEPYKASPIDIVTTNWIKEKKEEYKIQLKQLVHDLGVSKSDLSAIINEHKSLGERTKGLFYYYFKSLELERKK